jgi:hypothetical protein
VSAPDAGAGADRPRARDRRARHAAAPAVAAALAAACHAGPSVPRPTPAPAPPPAVVPADATPAGPTAAGPTAGSTAAGSSAGAAAAAPTAATGTAAAAGAGGAPEAATVAEVLDGRVAAGRLVRVRGRCLGYGGAAAEGPPPQTRSDWLLADAGRAVYVAGPFPPGCQPMGGGPDPVTVIARVAADTVAGLGGPGRPRRYLIGRAAVAR